MTFNFLKGDVHDLNLEDLSLGVAMQARNKRRPTHPGELLREETLPAVGLSPTEFAARLRVSRRTVNELLRERRAINPDLAHRISRLLGTTPEFWLRLQQAVDIWDTLQANHKKYERLKPLRERAA